MRFSVLGSGSKGNAVLVDGGGALILIDAGYAPRELRRRMQALDVELNALTALCITHGHADHIKGARAVASTLARPTYATEETQRFCAAFGGLTNHVPITPGEPFRVGDLQVLAVRTPHDAPGSVCFVVDDGAERLGVCTDLGEPDDRVAAALSTCDALVLEFNHDLEMLRNGPYSAHLKRRIASPRGHLSNAQGAQLLGASRGTGLTRVLCAHLSEVNNTGELAMSAARQVVDGADIEVSIAPQHHPTGWLAPRRKAAGRRPAGAATPERAVGRANAGAGRAPLAPPRAATVGHVALERQLSLFGARPTASSTPAAPVTIGARAGSSETRKR